MSMRRSKLSVICAVLALFGSGCASASSPAETPSPQGLSTPGTLQATASEEMDDLNPFTPTQKGKSQVLSAISMPMLSIDTDSNIASKLLTSWEQSPDATTVTLTLKPDLVWSDGEPVTSADLKMTLNAYLNPNISGSAGRIGAVVGKDAVADGTTKELAGLATPDDKTLTIQLATPDAAWLAKLALLGTYWPVLPAHVLSDVPVERLPDDDYFESWPVTNGPYQLSEFVYGQYVKVDRNPNWSLGTAGFEHVVFAIRTTEQMEAQLQSGEIHYNYMVDPMNAEQMASVPGVTVSSHQGVAPGLFAFNYATPEFKDPRIRQAMIYAIDRKSICEKLLAGHCTTPVTNLRQIAPEWALPDSGMTQYEYDPAKAKELLSAAGWDSSTKLKYYTKTQTAFVTKVETVVLGQLADVGIDFEVHKVTTGELLDVKSKTTGWHAAYVSGADFVVDPSQWATYLLCDNRYPDGPNTAQFCDPEVDELLNAGLATAVQEERAEYYHKAFAMLNKDPCEIYLYVVDNIVAYNAHLKGVTLTGNTSNNFADIGDWYWE